MTRIAVDDELQELVYDGYSWFWSFEGLWLTAHGVWRLLKDGRVHTVSSDHGEWFGLGHPLDVVNQMKTELTGSRLTTIDIDDSTRDVVLSFGERLHLQVLISSSGYESYDLMVGGKRYIGGGRSSLDISDWTNPIRPHIPLED